MFSEGGAVKAPADVERGLSDDGELFQLLAALGPEATEVFYKDETLPCLPVKVVDLLHARSHGKVFAVNHEGRLPSGGWHDFADAKGAHLE